MNFGKRTAQPEAARIVELALDHDITLLDTANAYGDGESERVLGRILKSLAPSLRDKARIATKVGFWRREGLSADRVVASLDESLDRLGVEQIELYYLHVPDQNIPIAATLEGIAAVLASGKAKAFGVSNYASWQILEIIHICDRMGIPRPAVSQQVYNLLIRQLDIEYLRFARQFELHTTVYNPLAGGLLAGRPTTAETQPGTRFHKNGLYQRRYLSDVFFDATNAFTDLARECGLSILTLAYAWLAQRPGVDSILVGPGSASHLKDAFNALEVRLTPDTLTRVDQIHRALVGTDTTYAR